MKNVSGNNDLTIQALQALFIAFPSQERSGNERELVKVYLMAVEGISADFIAMACKRFIQGQVERPSLTFRPTPPEMAVECRRLQDKAASTSSLLARLAAPAEPELPDPTPEERQRCAEMWARAKAQIQGAAEAMRMPRKSRFAIAPPDYTPKVDVSDFPPANASPAEVRAWEARQKAEAA